MRLVRKNPFGIHLLLWLKLNIGNKKHPSDKLFYQSYKASGLCCWLFYFFGEKVISLFTRRQRQENFFKLAGVAALFAKFVAVADGDESAAVDDADAVGHFLGHAQLMRGDEHGH